MKHKLQMVIHLLFLTIFHAFSCFLQSRPESTAATITIQWWAITTDQLRNINMIHLHHRLLSFHILAPEIWPMTAQCLFLPRSYFVHFAATAVLDVAAVLLQTRRICGRERWVSFKIFIWRDQTNRDIVSMILLFGYASRKKIIDLIILILSIFRKDIF